MLKLKYPNDRYDGYIMLESNGVTYVPRFFREEPSREKTPFLNYKAHWNAWRILYKRLHGANFEPCALSAPVYKE